MASDTREVDVAAPGGDGSRRQSCLTYLLFSIFGAGSAWLVIGATFLEVAVYEESLGLLVANRCSLGYQAGSLWVPAFMIIRWLLQRCGRDVNYRALIVFVFVLHLLNLAIAGSTTQTLESLVVISFIGGGCGYLSGVVHQAYLAVNCEDVYSAAFWAGDASAGAVSAVLAAIQQPELGPEGRLFGPEALYFLMIPVVLMAAGAFCAIDRGRLGYLPRRARLQRLPAEPGAPAEAHGCAVAPRPIGRQCLEEGLDAAAPWDPRNGEGGGAEARAEPLKLAAGQGEGHKPKRKGRHFERLEDETDVPMGNGGAKVEPLELESAEAARDAGRAAERGGLLSLFVPAAGREKPAFTGVLLLVGFWSSLTCWGIGDSVIPYACAQSSKADEGEACVFHCSEATVFAILVGTNCSGIIARPAMRHLLPTAAICTLAFLLLALAAAWGGAWSSPFLGPAMTIEALETPNGGYYIVVLVFFMRALQPFLMVTRQRMIQLDYPEEDVEGMNLFFYAFTVVANLAGVAGITILLS